MARGRASVACGLCSRLVGEHRVERGGAVRAGRRARSRAGRRPASMRSRMRVVLLDRLARAAGHEAERRVAQHLHAVPAAVHEVEDVRVRALLEQHRVELEVELGEPVRVEVVEACGASRSLIARARREVVGGRANGADSAVAAPSTSASVCMVCRYSVSLMSATWAPTLRSNVTRPSASSRRIASRTGTTLTSSSRAIGRARAGSRARSGRRRCARG